MKRILVTVLAALLVGSLITSVVLAAKPIDGNPVDQIDGIDTQVSDILATVTAIEEKTDNLTSELQALGITIASIDQQVGDTFSLATSIEEDTDNLTQEIQSLETRLESIEAALGSVPKIENHMGYVSITDNGSDVFLFQSDTYSQGAHFHITLDIYQMDSGDFIRVGRNYSGDAGSSGTATRVEETGLHTFELDAYACQIYYTTHSTAKLWFAWAVTITYAA